MVDLDDSFKKKVLVLFLFFKLLKVYPVTLLRALKIILEQNSFVFSNNNKKKMRNRLLQCL